MKNGWTAERRARQSEAIRRWKPWEKSTGPRTKRGKARVARNAYRGGMRPFLRALSAAMRTSTASERLLSEARSRTPRKRQRSPAVRDKPVWWPRLSRTHWGKQRADLGRLSKAENLQIKAGVARAVESGQPPLTAALQAMKDAWALGGPFAAARFAVLCLPHCHKRLPRRRVGPEELLP